MQIYGSSFHFQLVGAVKKKRKKKSHLYPSKLKSDRPAVRGHSSHQDLLGFMASSPPVVSQMFFFAQVILEFSTVPERQVRRAEDNRETERDEEKGLVSAVTCSS